MMKVRFNFLVVFLGMVFLVLLASNLYGKTLFESYPQGTTVIPEHLPASISRLNKMYDDVKTFVMFIGYSQRVDGLIGNILDAHPEILLPQEYDITGNWKMFNDKKLKEFGQQKYMLFFFSQYLSTFQSIFKNIVSKPSQFWIWKSKTDNIEYTYVPDAWQGLTRGNLKVIGDSGGLLTSKQLAQNKDKLLLLKEIQSVVDIPLKFVHIISNPYDIVDSKLAIESQHGIKINGTTAAHSAFKDIFALMDSNERIRKQFGNSVLDVHVDELFTSPRDTLNQICNFLQVSCHDSYINTVQYCLRNYKKTTWNRLDRTEAERDLIESEMKKYSFLESYTSNRTIVKF